MPANYVLLERIELNASAASVTFSNIPQTGYTDLKVVGSVRTTNASTYGAVDMTFNGSTTGYSSRNLEGGDGAAASFTTTGASSLKAGYISGGNATANTFGTFEVYIPNYTSSNNKSISIDSAGETNAANGIYMDLWASLWANSAAINSITLSSGNTLAQYSTFSLYGLAAVGSTPAIAPKASGGNITTDGTYWIHTFLASGTFTPAISLTCDYLVVAGGGGGGRSRGGGGGAGGFRTATSQTLTATGYAVTVGAGGAGGTSGTGKGTNGNNSVLNSTTSSGGGGGGGGSVAPSSGGSGGGGFYEQPTGASGNAGSYSPVEGYAGGTALGFSSGTLFPAAGGGGAGGVGGNPPSITVGGNGGNGASNSYSGSAVTYAGGGGGAVLNGGSNAGDGGTGGGGGASTTANVTGTDGTTNTGGGGGGGYGGSGGTGDSNGGAGGSGIVIIRYPIA